MSTPIPKYEIIKTVCLCGKVFEHSALRGKIQRKLCDTCRTNNRLETQRKSMQRVRAGKRTREYIRSGQSVTPAQKNSTKPDPAKVAAFLKKLGPVKKAA